MRTLLYILAAVLALAVTREIALRAIKLGRDRNEFSVERITAEQYEALSKFLSAGLTCSILAKLVNA